MFDSCDESLELELSLPSSLGISLSPTTSENLTCLGGDGLSENLTCLEEVDVLDPCESGVLCSSASVDGGVTNLIFEALADFLRPSDFFDCVEGSSSSLTGLL